MVSRDENIHILSIKLKHNQFLKEPTNKKLFEIKVYLK